MLFDFLTVLTQLEERKAIMKNIIKKIGVFVLALAFVVSTASAVLADQTGQSGQSGWSGSPNGTSGSNPPQNNPHPGN
jgi:hypothetical protein